MSANRPVRTQAMTDQTSHTAIRAIRLRAPGGQREWSVAANGSSIGSHPSNSVQLDDLTVSRFHCEIEEDKRGIFVRDLGSTNGTVIDGILVQHGYLRHGSLLSLGKSRLHVEFAGEVPAVPCSERTTLGNLVGVSTAMRRVFTELERAAKTDTTVLIRGETGTGKEAAAEAIHTLSVRRNGPFVVVDCGAIQPDLLESELFGYERGAFTGASEARAGAFEQADGGTLVLDEIGELPLSLQPKLLRVLEKREVRRLGQNAYRPLDVRIVAASHRDLRVLTNTGEFRADLYFRLAVTNVALPPLRERPEDLPLLADRLLLRLVPDPAMRKQLVSDEMLGHLRAAAWPGNVRELRNYLERCVVLGEVLPVYELDGPTWDAGAPPRVNPDVSYPEARKNGINEWEHHYLAAVVAHHKGQSMAAMARAIGIDRHYFYRLLQRHGLLPTSLGSTNE